MNLATAIDRYERAVRKALDVIASGTVTEVNASTAEVLVAAYDVRSAYAKLEEKAQV